MKKHRYWILELCMLLCYILFQFLHIVLRQKAVENYNVYFQIYAFIGSFVLVILLSVLSWFALRFGRTGVPLWQAGAAALCWMILGVIGLPRLLFALRIDQVSLELVGFTWVVAVWHVFEFFHRMRKKKQLNSIRNKKPKNQGSL